MIQCLKVYKINHEARVQEMLDAGWRVAKISTCSYGPHNRALLVTVLFEKG